jgi:plastocyanin
MSKLNARIACLLLVLFLSAAASGAATYTVNLNSMSFSPNNITILVNDTVHWVHVAGITHTVTSGTGPLDPFVGDLFDQSMPAGSTFDYTFTAMGDYPFFCRPHFSMGMIGVVHVVASTVSCDYTCNPTQGTVPFVTSMSVTMTNDYLGITRRLAGRIDVTTYSNWKSGSTNVAPGGSYITSWNQGIPALGSLIGSNVFELLAQDVTPSPFNQPPYPQAGDTDSESCTIVAMSP